MSTNNSNLVISIVGRMTKQISHNSWCDMQIWCRSVRMYI